MLLEKAPLLKYCLSNIPQKTKAVTDVSSGLKATLGRYSSLRHRLRSSFLRRIYRAIAKRETLLSRRREQEFYRQLLVGLQRDDLIFDIGANRETRRMSSGN